MFASVDLVDFFSVVGYSFLFMYLRPAFLSLNDLHLDTVLLFTVIYRRYWVLKKMERK